MMTRSLVAMLCGGALLSACSLFPSKAREQEAEAARSLAAARKPAPRTVAADGTPLARVEGVEIEKVPFRPGVSSATVENLAKQQGCTGGWGAGLVSEPGPVEIYRMTCENGKVFIAKCELKQCRAM